MKNIIVAGSSSGIGRAITEKMLAENHLVMGLARDHKRQPLIHPRYKTFSVDFSAIASLERQLKIIQKENNDIDIIICSVGYGEFIELEQFSVNQMQMMLNVNFLSQAILIKTFLSTLKKKKGGKIILIGSECALTGYKKASMYCASKFALRGFAQSLRKECAAAQIAVTLINPGIVDTPFFEDLPFCPAEGLAHAIQPDQLVTLVSLLTQTDFNCVYEEINLQPLKKVLQKKPNPLR